MLRLFGADYLLLLHPFEIAARLLAEQRAQGAHAAADWKHPVSALQSQFQATGELVLTLLGVRRRRRRRAAA